MTVLTIQQAQARYPEEWHCIEQEMREEALGLDMVLEAVTAEVTTCDGEMVLEVIAESDFVVHDDDESTEELAKLTFRAKLAAA